jgi:hypothetical protein
MIHILHELPVWVQLMICCSWLGLLAMVPCYFSKPLNQWPIFCSIYAVLLICLMPNLIQF